MVGFKTSQWPFALHPRALLLAALTWFGGVLLSVAYGGSTRPQSIFVTEAYIHLALMLLLTLNTAVVRNLMRFSRSQVAFLMTVLILMTSGQYRASSHETFPFVEWAMFTGSPLLTSYAEFTGEKASGALEPIHPAIASPTKDSRHLYRYLAADVEQMTREESPARHSKVSTLLMKEARRYTGEPYVALHGRLCFLPTTGFKGRDSIQCQRWVELARHSSDD